MLINLQKICYLDKIRPAGGDICIKRSPFLLVRGGINILLEDGRVRRRTESVLQAWTNFCSWENRFVICKNLMCTSAKKCLLSSPVFKPRLHLGQKTQTRTKNWKSVMRDSVLPPWMPKCNTAKCSTVVAFSSSQFPFRLRREVSSAPPLLIWASISNSHPTASSRIASSRRCEKKQPIS
jgi:hypothetical protein